MRLAVHVARTEYARIHTFLSEDFKRKKSCASMLLKWVLKEDMSV